MCGLTGPSGDIELDLIQDFTRITKEDFKMIMKIDNNDDIIERKVKNIKALSDIASIRKRNQNKTFERLKSVEEKLQLLKHNSEMQTAVIEYLLQTVKCQVGVFEDMDQEIKERIESR